MSSENHNLEPGIYYQDTLADGSRSELRINFPKLQRLSYDTRPPVVRTIKIEVTEIFSELQLTEELVSEYDLEGFGKILSSAREEAHALFKKDS